MAQCTLRIVRTTRMIVSEIIGVVQPKGEPVDHKRTSNIHLSRIKFSHEIFCN